MKKPDSKQRLVEVIKRLDPNFTGKALNESPKFGGQNVSQDMYDELQYDKSTMEKAMGDAFKTPEGYQMKNPVKGGETFQLDDGDTVKVLSVEGGFINVRVFPADETSKKYYKNGYFDIAWSPVQFDAIVGNKGSVDEKFNKWGQAQDAWANIENGPANTGKDLQKKANLAKKSSPEVGSGNGSSHVPEYYYSYDSEEAIPNTNNLTQGQIDAMNQKSRDRMQQDVRRSMNRGDGGWGMDESKEKFVFGKGTKKRLFEVMGRVAPNFNGKALKEGRYSGYERLDPPDDYYADEGDIEPETPSIKTADFKMHGSIENPGEYLYTIYETKPNSEFGDILMKVINSDMGYKRNIDGIYGADFDDELFPQMKQQLTPYMNIPAVSDFVKAAEKIMSEMPQYEEDMDNYKGNDRRGGYDREPSSAGDRDYNSSDSKNAWMDYVNPRS